MLHHSGSFVCVYSLFCTHFNCITDIMLIEDCSHDFCVSYSFKMLACPVPLRPLLCMVCSSILKNGQVGDLHFLFVQLIWLSCPEWDVSLCNSLYFIFTPFFWNSRYNTMVIICFICLFVSKRKHIATLSLFHHIPLGYSLISHPTPPHNPNHLNHVKFMTFVCHQRCKTTSLLNIFASLPYIPASTQKHLFGLKERKKIHFIYFCIYLCSWGSLQ